MSPESDVFLKKHLLADLFERDVLTSEERESATISALVSLGGVEPMLQFHVGAGLRLEPTAEQAQELIALAEVAAGTKAADAARVALYAVLVTNN